MPKLAKQLTLRKTQLICCQAQERQLQQRLEQFEAENRANRCPIQADFRLDAGFGMRENVALLIEMGYDVYTKPYGDWLTPRHLKVRSAPGLYLQEQLAALAANFVRWAARWLAEQCPQLPSGWDDTAQPRVKEQVKVAAHTSAWVSWQEQGCLLKFTDHSVFAGRSLQVERQWTVQLPLPFSESLCFGHL